MQNESWRPATFDEFIGQRDLIALAQDEVDASIAEQRPVRHMALYGPPGLGKTDFVEVLARVRRVPLHTIMGPSITEEGLSKILGDLNPAGYDDKGHLIDPSKAIFPIIFIDEAEEVPKSIWELAHESLQPDGSGRSIYTAKDVGKKQRFKMWHPHVTWIMATNYFGRLRKNGMAALNRVPLQWNFQRYSDDEVGQLLTQYAHKTRTVIVPEAVQLIARQSMGVPRKAIALIRQSHTRAVAMVQRKELTDLTITVKIAMAASGLLKIDTNGMPPTHLRYLQVLAKAGGKVSLSSLAAAMNMDEETIRTDIEPDLLIKELVAVVPGGRQLTDEGLEYVGAGYASPLLARRL